MANQDTDNLRCSRGYAHKRRHCHPDICGEPATPDGLAELIIEAIDCLNTSEEGMARERELEHLLAKYLGSYKDPMDRRVWLLRSALSGVSQDG